MQAVKDKLSDMATMRKVKAETKAEEKAEKEMAKTRVEVAKEIRKAKEAEAERDMHFARAGDKVNQEIAKHEANIVQHEPHLNHQPGQIIHDPVLGGAGSESHDHHSHVRFDNDPTDDPDIIGTDTMHAPSHNKFL